MIFYFSQITKVLSLNKHIVINGFKTQSGTFGEENLVISKNQPCTPAVKWEDDLEYTYFF